MNNIPRVTVLMPVYNAGEYLREAIDSILNQTFKDFELLIINDASTDNSLSVVQSYCDSRIILINNEINLGASATRNKGFDLARGEYIAQMDSDDISLSNRLARQVEFMDNHCEVDICGTFLKTFGLVNDVIFEYPTEHEVIRASFLFDDVVGNPSIILRKDSVNRYNLRYDCQLSNAEDFDLWIRCSEKLIFANLSDVLLKYRIRDNSLSKNNEIVQFNQVVEIIKNNFKRMGIEVGTWIEYFYNNEKMAIKDFIYIAKFLESIIKKNEATAIYDEKALYIVVEQKFSHFCNTSGYLGLKVFKEWYYFYRKHDIYKLLSIQTLKLLVKCLIRYNVKR